MQKNKKEKFQQVVEWEFDNYWLIFFLSVISLPLGIFLLIYVIFIDVEKFGRWEYVMLGFSLGISLLTFFYNIPNRKVYFIKEDG